MYLDKKKKSSIGETIQVCTFFDVKYILTDTFFTLSTQYMTIMEKFDEAERKEKEYFRYYAHVLPVHK